MLVSLIGKTTFIKNMFASYAQDADLKVNDVSPPTSKDEFMNSPEKLCTEIVVSDQTTQTRYHYKVQDTPGYDSMEVTTLPLKVPSAFSSSTRFMILVTKP